ncbi:hypothetical protein [Streptomyces sp. NPDC058664]|uniref:hypothetical protein n=1 Tax=unclassified Streptomyces TaxID=2593676 RepID=UPI003652E917
MYEMRAESVPGRSEAVWHVLAREQSATTLCGHRLPEERTETAPMTERAAERYCVRCMTAFRAAVEDRALRAAEAGRRSAVA